MNRRTHLSTNEKLTVLGNLSTMLTAGIPLLDAVHALLTDAKKGQRRVLEALRDDLVQGKHTWESLARFPSAFDTVTVNLVKAAEEAGTLPTVLRDLRDHIQRDAEFVDRVKFALLYPVIVLMVFAGVLLTMLVFVVPKISTVFSRLRIEIPLPTRMLMFLSSLLLDHTALVVAGTGIVIASLAVLYQVKRSMVLGLFFSLPLVSRLITEIELTRVSRSLSLLLSSGLPITHALTLVGDAVLRRDTARLIEHTREMILSGKRLSDGLRSAKAKVPTIMLTLVEAGEKSGGIDQAMADIAKYLDYQVSNTLKTLSTVMEPVLLVLVGLTVGGMMLSIIAPIYGLVGQLSVR